MDTARHAVEWGWLVLLHWEAGLAGGGIMGLIAIAIGLLERLVDKRLPMWAYISVVFFGFIMGSSFLAWDDEYNNVTVLERSNKILSAQNAGLSALNEKAIHDSESKPREVVRLSPSPIKKLAMPTADNDSIRTQIEMAISKIATLADEGTAVYNQFLKSNDVEALKVGYASWISKASSIVGTIDASFGTQFENAHGSNMMGCPIGKSIDGCGYLQDIQGKKDKLMDFIAELRKQLPPSFKPSAP